MPRTITTADGTMSPGPTKNPGMSRKHPKNRNMMASIMYIVALLSVLDPSGGAIMSTPSSLSGLPQDRQNVDSSGTSFLQAGHFKSIDGLFDADRAYTVCRLVPRIDNSARGAS